MNNINNNQPSHEGNLNPMYGKRHNELTKKKISDSQRARYAAIRKALQAEGTELPLGRTDRAARMDLLNQCLNKDTIGFDSVEQAHNFVAIMLKDEGKNYIQRIIKEEIDKMLNTNKHLK